MLMSVWVHNLIGTLCYVTMFAWRKAGWGVYIPAHASPPGNKQTERDV